MTIIKDKLIENMDLLNMISEGIYIVDNTRTISFWNKCAEDITGFKKEDVLGKKCSKNILKHVDEYGVNLCINECPLLNATKSGKSCEFSFFLHHKEGHRLPVKIRTSPIFDNDGEIVGAIEFFTDNSYLKALETKVLELKKLAFLDELTKVANRRYAEKQIEIRIAEFSRHNIPFGFFIMDIDNFKRVNDNYGHDIGDNILKMVSKTVVSVSRPYDLFARWGGEEFIGLISNVNKDLFIKIMNKYRVMIEKSFIKIKGDELLSVTASFGGALINEKDNKETIYERADKKLLQSKSGTKNVVTI